MKWNTCAVMLASSAFKFVSSAAVMKHPSIVQETERFNNDLNHSTFESLPKPQALAKGKKLGFMKGWKGSKQQTKLNDGIQKKVKKLTMKQILREMKERNRMKNQNKKPAKAKAKSLAKGFGKSFYYIFALVGIILSLIVSVLCFLQKLCCFANKNVRICKPRY